MQIKRPRWARRTTEQEPAAVEHPKNVNKGEHINVIPLRTFDLNAHPHIKACTQVLDLDGDTHHHGISLGTQPQDTFVQHESRRSYRWFYHEDPLLHRGEYSQWVERFMNYLEERTDGEAMINSIKNNDQPLPRVTQVSIAGTSSTEQPLLKDKTT
nr:hypothetical protein [Tanacetum cinerariifolium]